MTAREAWAIAAGDDARGSYPRPTAGDLFAVAQGRRSILVLMPTLPFNIAAGLRGTVAVKR